MLETSGGSVVDGEETNLGVQENTKPVRTLESRVAQLYLNN